MDNDTTTTPRRRKRAEPGPRYEYDWTRLDPRTRAWLNAGCPGWIFRTYEPPVVTVEPEPQEV